MAGEMNLNIEVPNQVRAVIVAQQNELRHSLRQVLETEAEVEVLAESDNLVYGYELIRQNRPQLALVSLGEQPQQTLEWIEKITTYQRHTMVVLIGPEPDKALLHEAMAAGVRQWLPQPFQPETLLQLLQAHREQLLLDPERGDRTGRIISVFSKKGGLGKTTMAVNLAFALSQVTSQSVVVVDLNLQLGDISTFLELESGFTISQLSQNLARADEDYLKASIPAYKTAQASVYVLADHQDMTNQTEELTAPEVNKLLTILRSSFDYVLVDVSTTFEPRTLMALDLSDTILLLTSIVNLPCIKSTQQVLTLFERLGYDHHKIKLVINRFVPDEEITLDDVQTALKRDVFWKIPNDYHTVMNAINQGLPLCEAAEDTPVWEHFLELAYRLSGRIRPKQVALGERLIQPEQKRQNPILRLLKGG
jgi:pilus assembly protein CpaE